MAFTTGPLQLDRVCGLHHKNHRNRGGSVKGELTFLPYCGYVTDVSPQEQWGNIPVIGKLQILTFVGMLESYGAGRPAGLLPADQGQPPGDPLRPLQAVRPRVADTITLADIAHLPLMRCRQLLTWFVTACQPAGVLVCDVSGPFSEGKPGLSRLSNQLM